MLKLGYELKAMPDGTAAAFRRLCVETMPPTQNKTSKRPAAFRRLCVETLARISLTLLRLPSRLQAAVC